MFSKGKNFCWRRTFNLISLRTFISLAVENFNESATRICAKGNFHYLKIIAYAYHVKELYYNCAFTYFEIFNSYSHLSLILIANLR